jgi:hypothetical protein
MKKLVIAAVIALFGALTVVAPSRPVIAQSANNVTGDWIVQITGDQFLVGSIHLTQVGNTVVGSAVPGNKEGVLQINGTIDGTKLSAKWRAPKGAVGWMTLNFNPSFNAFSGEWGYGGRSPNGSIVSKQFTATAF